MRGWLTAVNRVGAFSRQSPRHAISLGYGQSLSTISDHKIGGALRRRVSRLWRILEQRGIEDKSEVWFFLRSGHRARSFGRQLRARRGYCQNAGSMSVFCVRKRTSGTDTVAKFARFFGLSTCSVSGGSTVPSGLALPLLHQQRGQALSPSTDHCPKDSPPRRRPIRPLRPHRPRTDLGIASRPCA